MPCADNVESYFKTEFGQPLPDSLRQLALTACVWFNGDVDHAFQFVAKAYTEKQSIEQIRKDLGGLTDLEKRVAIQLLSAGNSIEKIKKRIVDDRKHKHSSGLPGAKRT